MFRALIAILLLSAALPAGARADEARDCSRASLPNPFQALDDYMVSWHQAHTFQVTKPSYVLEEIKVGEKTDAKLYRVHEIAGIPKAELLTRGQPASATDPSPVYVLELGKPLEGPGAPVTAKGGRQGDQALGKISFRNLVELNGELQLGAIQLVSIGGIVRPVRADFAEKTLSISPVTQATVSHIAGAAGTATSVNSGGGLSLDLPASKGTTVRGRVTIIVGPEVLHNVHGATVQPSANGALEFLFF